MAAYTTIDDPEAYFQTILYTGASGTNPRSHTLPGDTDMQPDLVWLKKRNTTEFHVLTDAVRGAGKMVISNNSDGEATNSNSGYISAFNSDGFTTTNGSSNELYVNTTGATYVGWCWKESATAGFDIVTYSGTGSAKTESHSLSAVPEMYIVKRRDSAGAWGVYHSALGNGYKVKLDTTDASSSSSYWNSTSPTSSVFSLGTSSVVNGSSATYVAYLFRSVPGFSKVGTYEGNNASGTGDADGTFVHLGFRPAYVLIKAVDESSQNWHIFDNKRTPYNVVNKRMYADTDAAEATYTMIDFLSNGFKIRVQDAAVSAANTYIYLAFAEAPFVNSNGVPCNAR